MQAVGLLIAIAVGLYLLYMALTEFSAWLNFSNGFIIFLVIAIPLFLFSRWTNSHERKLARNIAKSPPAGPMKVKLTEVMHPRGGPWTPFAPEMKNSKCSLDVQVVINRKDWQIIQDAGLMTRGLFTYRNPQSPFKDQPDDFTVKALAFPGPVYFYDVIEMQSAKRELIDGLHALKSQVEGYREAKQPGNTTESFEL
jgi:hypothetical protein